MNLRLLSCATKINITFCDTISRAPQISWSGWHQAPGSLMSLPPQQSDYWDFCFLNWESDLSSSFAQALEQPSHPPSPHL